MKGWVVRYTMSGDAEFSSFFLDQLRYAGTVEVHSTAEDSTCFDLLAPAGVGIKASKLWSAQTADRARAHGFDAIPVLAGTPWGDG